MGTPKAVWQTMVRCWQMEPTSERIVEDIVDFPRVLQILIDYNGCVVPDLAIRHGRRAMSHDLKKVLKNKPRPSQRKATLVGRPCHPDCWAARATIKAAGSPAAETVQDAALGLLLLIEADDTEREEAQEQNGEAQLEDESAPQA
jgi:hypothetical protein